MRHSLETVIAEHALRLTPPLHVLGSRQYETFDDASVDLADGPVTWRIIQERSILDLLAAPAMDTALWFDADLLGRLVGRPTSRPRWSEELVGGLPFPVSRSVEEIFEDLQRLRPLLAVIFDQTVWPETRQRLQSLGRQRDFERWGRPLPDGEAE